MQKKNEVKFTSQTFYTIFYPILWESVYVGNTEL